MILNLMIMRLYYFEKMEVWKLSFDIGTRIYGQLKNFPKDEIYGLTSQIKRAVSSISSDIAEGFGRRTAKAQANFTNMSYTSMLELINHLNYARALEYIDDETYLDLRLDLEKLGNMLNALWKKQLARAKIESNQITK